METGRVGLFVAVTAALLLFAPSALAVVPTIKATWATEVTATSFRAKAIFRTEGLTSTYRFDYLSLASYEANLKAGDEGFKGASRMPIAAEAKVLGSATDEEVSQRIAALTPDTAYRYRMVAKNSSGEKIGPERTVTTQEAAPTFELAEGRGWEMVSPIDKNGGQIASPEGLFGGGDFQAAAQAGSVTYGSASSFAGAKGAPGASQYLSVRTSSGWSTTNLTLPTEAGAFGPEPDGVSYRLFSPDLSEALVLSKPSAFELLSVPGLIGLDSLSGPDLVFVGASEDLAHVLFTDEGGNLYRRSGGISTAINIEPGDASPTPGAQPAAQGANSISTDGARIYWVDHEGGLILRDGNRSVEVDGEGQFQVASTDGSVAYFTKAAHLYRYVLTGESSTDITPSGGVVGVLGASGDGGSVYYQDGSGLERWQGGATNEVAPGPAADPSDYPPTTGTARVSADGESLAFLSSQDLSGFEGLGATELFLYQAGQDRLLCASCNPTGARPLGPSTIPGAIANGEEVQIYKPRAMDAGGTRLFFDTADSLSPKDTNGEQDVYEWRAQGVGGCQRQLGCIGIVSSGKGEDGSSFVDASADGTDAFFLAGDSLVESDPGGVDLYDARIGGGFPTPPKPIPCIGDACQPLPPEPEDPTPGTMFIGSERNPELHLQEQGKKKGKHHRHHKGKKHRGDKGKKGRGAR